MGMFLNSATPYALYESEWRKPYFVDKSLLLEELMPLAETGNSHICITRPRRFGKTVMANMVGAYFGRGADAETLFSSLKIAERDGYRKHLNRYDVIYIDCSRMPRNCISYTQYIERIETILIHDLQEAYPEAGIREEDTVWDCLDLIFERCQRQRFVFILDEWDCIFHRDFVTEEDKRNYLSFLGNLLKDKAYVSFTYMTGILPIAKYSSGSELNMFLEYTMAGEEKFSDAFGFTETEVDMLYARFLKNTEDSLVSRDGLKEWYDGYHTKSGERMYNPRSVVAALTNNNLGNYWTSSGPYDEISYYINQNISGVRDDLALMVSGEAVPVKVREYAATSMKLTGREEIFSAMVVYGFLSCENGMVRIPNRELMERFDELLQKEPGLGYVYQLAKESGRMLDATLRKDTAVMEQILEFAHNTEIPLLSYNHETELSAIVNLVYLAARDWYRVEREDKAGKGYVDFIFYPIREADDAIILELKVDHTPEEAITQIKEKQYGLRLMGKLGQDRPYKGRILAVGIGYDKESQKHHCKVEELNI